MLAHYLSVAALGFRKSPIVALANVAVLALGLTAFVAAYAVTDFWSGAERQFANAQRTFIVSSRIEMSDGSIALYETPATNSYIASYLPIDFPQIEAVARARTFRGDVSISGGGRTDRLFAVAVDPEFLEIFDLPFIAGDARRALAQPRSVVLTEAAARRLFGAEGLPLGRTISLANRVDATVTGIISAIAEPSHMARSAAASLPFEMLASMDLRDAYLGVTETQGPENWLGIDSTTYVLLPADQSLSVAELQAGLEGIVARHMPDQQAAFGHLLLEARPVTEMLGLDASGAFLGGRGSISAVLWLLGFLVLGVACINYASLAAARAASRAHDVGVRKAIGARSLDVLLQHLLEAGLLTSAALVLAVLFVRALSPIIDTAWGLDMSLALSAEPRFVGLVVAAVMSVTLFAGAYPAFVLSRVRPIFALRAFRQRPRGSMLLAALVGIQVSAASFLSIAVAVIHLQNGELRTALADAADALLVIDHQRELTGLSGATLREELLRLPQVLAVTAAAENPLSSSDAFPLARSADDAAPQRMVPAYGISTDFASVFDLELLAGRFFAEAAQAARAGSARNRPEIVIDRALAEFLGFEEPADAIGEVVYVPKNFVTSFGGGTTAQPRQIIGVVENKPLGLYAGVHRGAVYREGADPAFTIARIAHDEAAAAIEEIDALWGRLAPGVAVKRRFAAEMFAEEYAQYARISNAMAVLCSFAVLIAVIGLFAMAQVVVARRYREVAVRKVLGAKTPRMIVMLLEEFALPVLAASLAAWPAALIAMRGYLDRFAAPIELDASLFVACFLGTLLVALLTIGAQILRATRVRPGEALRHE